MNLQFPNSLYSRRVCDYNIVVVSLLSSLKCSISNHKFDLVEPTDPPATDVLDY